MTKSVTPTLSETLAAGCVQVAQRAKNAAAQLAMTKGEVKIAWLYRSAALLRKNQALILAANEKDLQAATENQLSEAMLDRLRLNETRIEAIAESLEQVAELPDPIGSVLESVVRPNGLDIQKVRVPLGVVFFIYESRPNVTADAAAICVKAGNAVILRGGKEAAHSSRAIVASLTEAANETDFPQDAVQLVETTDRAAVGHYLQLADLIDVVIPRGGESLIRRVVAEATMPVIKHYAGNCHVYIDAAADPQMAIDIVVNGKCQRMGVCNATESLVVHVDVAKTILPQVAQALLAQGIEVRGDKATCTLVPEAVGAIDADFYTEYLGPQISVRVVGSCEDAIEHINKHSSGHTEAIVTSNLQAANAFTQRIDSAAVVVNASTRFNDGGEFGKGAEIGISTDKFHARGPCGIEELTSYKYIVRGTGQIRE